MYYTTKKGPSCANRIALEKSALSLPFRSQCLTSTPRETGGPSLLYPKFLGFTTENTLPAARERTFL